MIISLTLCMNYMGNFIDTIICHIMYFLQEMYMSTYVTVIIA